MASAPDNEIQNLRDQQVNSMMSPRYNPIGSDKWQLVPAKSTSGERVVMAKKQVSYTESARYLYFLNPDTPTTTALTSTAIQSSSGGVTNRLAQYRLIQQIGILFYELWMELEATTPVQNTSYAAIMPGPLWIEAIITSMNGGKVLQNLPGDIIMLALLWSIPLERLYAYACASGNWLNPPNMPGVTPPVSPIVSATNQQTFNSYQLLSAQYALFPWQPKLLTTAGSGIIGYPDASAAILQITFPIPFWCLLSGGFFDMRWIGPGKMLVLDIFTNRPIYNTIKATTDNDINTCTMSLLMKGISFPGNGPTEQYISKVVNTPRGIHINYIEFARLDTPMATTNQVSGSKLYINLDQWIGRKISFFIVFFRNPTGFNGSGYLLGTDTTLDVPTPSSGSNNNISNQAAFVGGGHRMVLGDPAANLPSMDYINTSGIKVFSNDRSTTVRHLQHVIPTGILVNNPWMMNLVGGQTTWAPYYTNSVPMFFGDPLAAQNGVSTSTIEPVQGNKLLITYGANPQQAAYVTTCQVYAAYWQTMHLNSEIFDIENLPSYKRVKTRDYE